MSILQKIFDASASAANKLDEIDKETFYRIFQRPRNAGHSAFTLLNVKQQLAQETSSAFVRFCRAAESAADKKGKSLNTSKLKV